MNETLCNPGCQSDFQWSPKTKIKVITLPHHIGDKRKPFEPIKTPNKYMQPTQNAGKRVGASYDWLTDRMPMCRKFFFQPIAQRTQAKPKESVLHVTGHVPKHVIRMDLSGVLLSVIEVQTRTFTTTCIISLFHCQNCRRACNQNTAHSGEV